jgi:hypothetical protein
MVAHNSPSHHNPAKEKKEISLVRDFLFVFLTIWTAIIFAGGWLTFFFPHLTVPNIAVSSYLMLLGVYVLHKEIMRWTGTKKSEKPGEKFVYIWWLSLLLMVLIAFLTRRSVPEGVTTIAFEILAALLGSEISKAFNVARKRNTGSN